MKTQGDSAGLEIPDRTVGCGTCRLGRQGWSQWERGQRWSQMEEPGGAKEVEELGIAEGSEVLGATRVMSDQAGPEGQRNPAEPEGAKVEMTDQQARGGVQGILIPGWSQRLGSSRQIQGTGWDY